MDTTNKPVAWLVQYPDRHEFRWKKPEHLYEALACEPLYTHPNEHDLGIAEAVGFDKGYQAAATKTLTDEEIEQVWIQALQDEPKVNAGKFPSLANQPFVFFARAVLRKAQEQ